MRRFDGLRPRTGLIGLFQRLLAGVLGVVAFIVGLAFSLVALLTLIATSGALALRWWWTLRGVRQSRPGSSTNPRGVVIEGEVLREERTSTRLPPGDVP